MPATTNERDVLGARAVKDEVEHDKSDSDSENFKSVYAQSNADKRTSGSKKTGSGSSMPGVGSKIIYFESYKNEDAIEKHNTAEISSTASRESISTPVLISRGTSPPTSRLKKLSTIDGFSQISEHPLPEATVTPPDSKKTAVQVESSTLLKHGDFITAIKSPEFTKYIQHMIHLHSPETTTRDNTRDHSLNKPSEQNTGQYAPFEHDTGQYAPFEHDTGQYAPFEHDTGQYAPFEHDTGQYAPFKDDTVQYAPFEHDTGQYAPFEHATGQYAPFKDDTVRYTTFEHDTAQYSAFENDIENDTVQYKASENDTVQYKASDQNSAVENAITNRRMSDSMTAPHNTFRRNSSDGATLHGVGQANAKHPYGDRQSSDVMGYANETSKTPSSPEPRQQPIPSPSPPASPGTTQGGPADSPHERFSDAFAQNVAHHVASYLENMRTSSHDAVRITEQPDTELSPLSNPSQNPHYDVYPQSPVSQYQSNIIYPQLTPSQIPDDDVVLNLKSSGFGGSQLSISHRQSLTGSHLKEPPRRPSYDVSPPKDVSSQTPTSISSPVPNMKFYSVLKPSTKPSYPPPPCILLQKNIPPLKPSRRGLVFKSRSVTPPPPCILLQKNIPPLKPSRRGLVLKSRRVEVKRVITPPEYETELEEEAESEYENEPEELEEEAEYETEPEGNYSYFQLRKETAYPDDWDTRGYEATLESKNSSKWKASSRSKATSGPTEPSSRLQPTKESTEPPENNTVSGFLDTRGYKATSESKNSSKWKASSRSKATSGPTKSSSSLQPTKESTEPSETNTVSGFMNSSALKSSPRTKTSSGFKASKSSKFKTSSNMKAISEQSKEGSIFNGYNAVSDYIAAIDVNGRSFKTPKTVCIPYDAGYSSKAVQDSMISELTICDRLAKDNSHFKHTISLADNFQSSNCKICYFIVASFLCVAVCILFII